MHIARRVRAPKGAACKGAPAPKGRRMHIARRVRAPKGAACKGAPTPEGCRSCIARRVRVPKGAACAGAPAPLGRQFQIARRVRAIALVLPCPVIVVTWGIFEGSNGGFRYRSKFPYYGLVKRREKL